MSVKPEWRDRASGFFALSGMKLRNVTQTAGIFVGDVAKDAGTGVAEVAEMAAEVAERAGTAMRARWSLLQQARQQNAQQSLSSEESVQERLKSAAATTSILLKRSLLETKEKVAVGRVKVEQAAKRAAERSRSILERWQKGQADTNVFGTPLETLVQRQKSSRPVPQIVSNCVDYLVSSGLNTPNIFKSRGDERVVEHLRNCYEEDWNAAIPEGTSPVDVAALLKRYLQMLPEPLLTFPVYNEIKEAGGNVRQLSDLLRTIPYAHYSTLECITSLLYSINQKSAFNKMDAHSLAFELAPYLLWKQSRGPRVDNQQVPFTHSRSLPGSRSQDSDIRDVDSVIPLDDEPSVADFAIIEAVQCLIEQQKVIFVDPIEAIRREFGE